MATNNWWEWEEDGAGNRRETDAFVRGLEQANQQRLDAQQVQARIQDSEKAERDRFLTEQARKGLFAHAQQLSDPDRTNWLMGEHSPFMGQQHFSQFD